MLRCISVVYLLDAVSRSLRITNADLDDAGRYNCTAVNDIGSDTELIDIRISTVLTGVRIVGPSQVEIGSTVELHCTIVGQTPQPRPTFEWYFNGQRITSGEYFRWV